MQAYPRLADGKDSIFFPDSEIFRQDFFFRSFPGVDEGGPGAYGTLIERDKSPFVDAVHPGGGCLDSLDHQRVRPVGRVKQAGVVVFTVAASQQRLVVPGEPAAPAL